MAEKTKLLFFSSPTLYVCIVFLHFYLALLLTCHFTVVCYNCLFVISEYFVYLHFSDPLKCWSLAIHLSNGGWFSRRCTRPATRPCTFVINPSLFLTLKICLLLKWQFFSFFYKKLLIIYLSTPMISDPLKCWSLSIYL